MNEKYIDMLCAASEDGLDEFRRAMNIVIERELGKKEPTKPTLTNWFANHMRSSRDMK